MNYLHAEVKAASGDGPGEFEAIASAPTLDRDNEVVDAKAFTPLPDAVNVHVDHNMTVDGLVGYGRPFYNGDELRLRGTFLDAPRAQMIRQALVAGVPISMSVGFLGAKSRIVDGVRHITKAELLEVSFVTVPSNRDERVVAARNFRDGTAAELRRMAMQAQVMLAELDLEEAKRFDRWHTRVHVPADARRLAAEAESYLRTLDERN